MRFKTSMTRLRSGLSSGRRSGLSSGRRSGLSSGRRSGRFVRSDRGALNVEFIGVLPLILLVTALCAQGLLIASLLPAVQQASRDGARAASVGQPIGAAVERALPDWATVERIEVGGAAQAGCAGHCVRVYARVPFGLPTITFSDVTVDRFTEMPR